MKRILAPSLVLATALTLAACAGSDDPTMDMPGGSMSESAPASDDAHDGETFNDADVMFAQMMIPHHQQAIEMSDVILGKDGIDSQITDLATQIKQAQGPEIGQLTTWLDEWGAEQPDDSMDMDQGDMDMGDESMDGMMSEEDMQALEDAQGEEAGRLFLEQMIVHHEGAIEMAQTEVEDGAHEAAIEMASTIVSTQSREIRTMEDLLAGM
ncbi:DUF305 domain-containing protein [Promicromonospora sp. NPDC050880]|uniref:DUF305 domain-containing protein n=1 Tax=Promicromonospora sp. NPDC050880 TaxID=3364406 RepID=UPI0037A42658